MSQPLYVVVSTWDGYDSFDISHHLTRKGALKFIMRSKYNDWELCRYIQPGSYDESRMWIVERELYE